MIDEHDRETVYCRRLGHHVPFAYCREESLGTPCRLVFDCWTSQFDVVAFLRANLPPETFAKLERPAPPPDKRATLFDLIRQARARLEKDGKPDEPPSDPST